MPLLGMKKTAWVALSKKIDVVLHTVAIKGEPTSTYDSLKGVNVLGTQECLRLAAEAGASFHYASSRHGATENQNQDQDQVIMEGPIYDGSDSRGRPAGDVGLGFQTGYCETRYAAERLILHAGARGINVAIYRVGGISGHSMNGSWHDKASINRNVLTLTLNPNPKP